MRTVKKYMMATAFFLVYMVAITIILKSYYVYQSAYQKLSRLISHSSVEVIYDWEE